MSDINTLFPSGTVIHLKVPLRILLADDNLDDRLLTCRELRKRFPLVQVEEVADADALARALVAGQFDAVITDFQMGWTDGLEVLEQVRKRRPDCPVIMFTGTGSEAIAVAAMKSGLDDYVVKSPKEFARLPDAVWFALQRREAVRERLRLESRLSQILNLLNVGVFRCTLEGELREANPAFLRLLGWAAVQDGAGRNLHDLFFGPAERDKVVRELRADGRLRGREVRLVEGDRTIWGAVTEVVNDAEDGESLVEGLLEDVSERKRLEEDLRRLVTTVSHEIRTPLTSIQGALRLLVAERGNALTPRAVELLDIARRGSDRLLRLTRSLLDLQRIESGPDDLRTKPVELMPLVERVIRLNTPYAQEHGVTLALEGAVPGARVRGEEDPVVQVLTNLLSNGCKFSPSGKPVTIAVVRRGAALRVSVTDQGEGIPEEIRGKIFRPFVRAGGSQRNAMEGSGLGLTISKDIVERLGGRIGFETESGKGTTFYFDLPEERSS